MDQSTKILHFSFMEIKNHTISNTSFKGCHNGELTIMSCSTSSEYSASYTCDKAFDGNEGDGWATSGEGDGAWIKVNLDSLHHLTKVMVMQRSGEYFKDISLDFLDGGSKDFTLSNSKVWEEIELADNNITTNYVKISAINVHNKVNNGFAELKVFGCAAGIYRNKGYLLCVLIVYLS